MAQIGIPVKLLHESMGHVITVELENGELLRGKLFEVEDNFNMQILDVTCTSRSNQVSHMERVYVRGSCVKLVVVPDMLKNAPMFKKQKNLGVGKGRTALSRKSRYTRPLYGT
eukprot:NODE_199_length_13192_cov_0.539219.p12 type:complete len:113 gc:universal NODE_199_length_13192_cov_0.539219:2119-1781(-)